MTTFGIVAICILAYLAVGCVVAKAIFLFWTETPKDRDSEVAGVFVIAWPIMAMIGLFAGAGTLVTRLVTRETKLEKRMRRRLHRSDPDKLIAETEELLVQLRKIGADADVSQNNSQNKPLPPNISRIRA